MLAFISDLHLSDGTAIAGNVAPEAFDLVLDEITDLAEQVARARDQPTHVDLVLLGDIFDMLRTERWFEDRDGNAVPLAERPWASPAALRPNGQNPAALVHARAMVEEIVEKNAEALATLRGERAPIPEGVTLRRIYVPGNHDRLFLHDEGIRARMLVALGAVAGDGLAEEGFSLHKIEKPEYGVIARHGHEWDMWNFPGFRGHDAPADFQPEEYLATPIGDPVATEMAARLPYELSQRLRESRAFSAEEVRLIHERFKRIDDVRPLFAAFYWAYYAAEQLGKEMERAQDRALRMALDDALRAIARAFRELPFYEAWKDLKHVPLSVDAPVLLRAALWAMSSLGAPPLRKVAEVVEKALRWKNPHDAARSGSQREDLARVGSEEMRFVVYGHTHVMVQVALRGSPITQDVYLNTGTYRPGIFRAEEGPGFIGWNRLGYVCLSTPEEAIFESPVFGLTRGGPAFVSWAGARSHGSPSRTGGPTIQ